MFQIATLSVMLATFMQALDSTIANVALPHMQGSLSGTQDQMTWILTSYITAAAIFLPVTGWLADRFGRRTVFAVSVGGFTLASALCGVAGTLEQIVLFRLLQGIFGASLVPLSQAIMLDMTPRERHGQAMAIWGAGVMLGPILGPTLGGWLTENYSWRWVFYINVPFGLLSITGVLTSLPETPRLQGRRFDRFGFATLGLAVGAFQIMLDRGELKGWFGSVEIWLEAAAALLGAYLFIVHSLTGKKPFINPILFRDRNFMACTALIMFIFAIYYGTFALLPPFLHNLMNYPVVTAGLVMAPRGLGTLIVMVMVSRLNGQLDTRLILALGIALLAVSLWQMTDYTTTMDEMHVVWPGFVQGTAFGFLFSPMVALAFSTIPVGLRTEGAALFGLLRSMGGSVGISVFQALFTENSQINHATMGEHVTAATLATTHPAGSVVAALDAQISQQAAVIAYVDDFKLMFILSLLAFPMLLLLRSSRQQGPLIAME